MNLTKSDITLEAKKTDNTCVFIMYECHFDLTFSF